MTTRQSVFCREQPYATAAAAFPAETVITPRAFSSGVSVESLARIPRGLKEPVF
jgi:hypothetical protein